MNEPPPIYGDTAEGWRDQIQSQEIRQNNALAHCLLGLGGLLAILSLGYPTFAQQATTVSDWSCPPQSVLKHQAEPLQKTWVTKYSRAQRRYRTQIDCRSFSLQQEPAKAKSIISQNRLSLSIWSFVFLFSGMCLRIGWRRWPSLFS